MNIRKLGLKIQIFEVTFMLIPYSYTLWCHSVSNCHKTRYYSIAQICSWHSSPFPILYMENFQKKKKKRSRSLNKTPAYSHKVVKHRQLCALLEQLNMAINCFMYYIHFGTNSTLVYIDGKL